MSDAHERGGVQETVRAVATTSELKALALSLRDVVRVTSLSRAHVYALIVKGNFPAPAKVGRRSIWDANEVEAWVRARFQERGCR